MMGTAEATINAIHEFREARVMGHRKRSRSPRQSPPPSQQPPSQQPPSAKRPKRPVFIFPSPETLPALWRDLESCQRRYEQGDHAALLEALWAWLTWCQGPPDWIVRGYHAAMMKFAKGEAPTLDAAFGVHRPPGEHEPDRRERQMLRQLIMFGVEELRQQKVPLKVAFDRIGADIRHGGGYVKDVYYESASSDMREYLQAFRVRRILPKS